MKFRDYIESRSSIINKALDKFIISGNKPANELSKAMRYSLLAGGKRIRPILAVLTAESLGKEIHEVLEPACALEFIHTYSLIHDDLPIMDNDDYRRGKLTNHKVFNQNISILAGINLLVNAYQLLINWAKMNPGWQVFKLINTLASASGLTGLVGGQVLDLDSEGKSLDIKQMRQVHRMKTGAMIKASVLVGAIAASAKEEDMDILSRFATGIGVAFQIIDDVLDVEGNLHSLGKSPGGDVSMDKSTYPSIVGIENSRKFAFEEIGNAKQIMKSYSGNSKYLLEFADYVYYRKN